MEIAARNGIIAHRQAHRDFEEKLSNYVEKASSGTGAFITTTVMKTLNDWPVIHIGRMDKLYGTKMNEAGIR